MPNGGAGDPSLRARRTQYRVGHGGFHATVVNPVGPSSRRLTYVYDVGARPHKALLLTAIDSFVAELEAFTIDLIDFIVISHIDEDHVNGVEELLAALKKKSIRVGTVVLPWLSPVQKLLTQQRNNHRQPGTAVRRLASSDDVADAFLHDAGVQEVLRITGGSEDPPPAGSSRSNIRRQGSNIAGSHHVGWTLVPMKMELPPGVDAQFLTTLNSLLRQHRLDANDPADHPAILTWHRKSIKKAMAAMASKAKVAAKDITNWSSLALLHGATTSFTCTITTPADDLAVDCTHGWLHTGDLPLKNPEVWSMLSSQLASHPLASGLCVVLAPHHGSNNNHEASLYVNTAPGTVILTTGTKLSGRNVGRRSYGLSSTAVDATARILPATVIDLHNR